LSYLAERNVIHRDLKVANVFLHNGRAKIADFGFAKFTKYLCDNKDKSLKI
jgi:serine/threonine protein kinase